MTYVSRVLGLFHPSRAENKGNKVRTGDTAVVKYSGKTGGARTARGGSSSLWGLLLRTSGQEALGIGARQEEAAQAKARLAQRRQYRALPCLPQPSRRAGKRNEKADREVGEVTGALLTFSPSVPSHKNQKNRRSMRTCRPSSGRASVRILRTVAGVKGNSLSEIRFSGWGAGWLPCRRTARSLRRLALG